MQKRKQFYVGNLPYNCTINDICDFFAGMATVQKCVLACNNETGAFRGFAFVTLNCLGDEDIVLYTNRRKIGGREIIVKIANKQK